MKKIMQDKFGLGGNCMSATIATLLGLDLKDVPSFWDGCDLDVGETSENGAIFCDNVGKFLKSRGYASICIGENVPHVEWVTAISKGLPDALLLIGGKSPRGYMHSVIWKNGELWHDPHPEGGGVVAQDITFIVPLFERKD